MTGYTCTLFKSGDDCTPYIFDENIPSFDVQSFEWRARHEIERVMLDGYGRLNVSITDGKNMAVALAAVIDACRNMGMPLCLWHHDPDGGWIRQKIGPQKDAVPAWTKLSESGPNEFYARSNHGHFWGYFNSIQAVCLACGRAQSDRIGVFRRGKLVAFRIHREADPREFNGDYDPIFSKWNEEQYLRNITYWNDDNSHGSPWCILAPEGNFIDRIKNQKIGGLF